MSDSRRSNAVTKVDETIFGSEILVPLEAGIRGEQAAKLGAELASLLDAGLLLESVVIDPQAIPLRKTYLDQLAAAMSPQEPASVRTNVCVSNRVARCLVDTLTPDTSVVMATRSTIAPHEGHVGSIAEAVIRASSRPGVLIGPRAFASLVAGFSRLVVPVDGSANSETALAPAADLARRLDLPVWVVTVVTPHMAQTAARLGVEPPSESGYVRRLAHDLAADGVNGQFEVLHRNDPAEAILEFAGRSGMCVVSTHGRTGLRRLAVGSVTAQVVRYACWPTVVVPPGR